MQRKVLLEGLKFRMNVYRTRGNISRVSREFSILVGHESLQQLQIQSLHNYERATSA